MDDWKLPWAGGCRCGKVRFEVTAPPLLSIACHCTGCQSMTSSAFALSLSIPTEGFAVTQGEAVIGGLHGEVRHFFCDWCKTWMFTRPGASLGFINIRPSLLDEHAWVAPYVEVFTDEKLAWATTPARHSYATMPGWDAFPGLVREYAEHGVRPI